MEISTESKLTNAALRYLSECFHFKNETGMSVDKANELLSAAVVNRWLDANRYSWKIAISSAPRGIDGTIVGDHAGPRDVEFKSSSSKNPSFQFGPGFNFANHGCIVMTQMSEGVPCRIFVAFGEKSIAAIGAMAKADMERLNFRADKGDMALVHMTTRRASSQRRQDVAGLADCLATVGSSGIDRNDQIVMIEKAQLAEFLKP